MTLSRQKVEALEKIIGQIEGLYEEVSLLSKKSPNDAVNTFKISLINNYLTAASDLLGESYNPIPNFTGFDKDDVPSNSDVVFVISQFRNELERYRSDCLVQNYGHWYFQLDERYTNGEPVLVPTSPPRKILRK